MPIPLSRLAVSLCRVVLAGGCFVTSAHADVMRDAAWVECDQAQDRFKLRHGALSRNDPGATVFWSLVEYSRRPDGDPDRVTKLHSVRHRCRLSGGLVEVVLSPVPMNHHLQGMCGAVVRGSVTILRNGKPILLERELETGDCAGPTRRIETITVFGGNGQAVVELAKEAD